MISPCFFYFSFLILLQDIGKAFRQLSSAAVETSASPSLDKIGACYEEMAGMVETQPAKVGTYIDHLLNGKRTDSNSYNSKYL